MTIKLSEKQRKKLLNSEDVYNVMQEILLREEKIDREKEHFWIIGLASNNRILFIELVSMGTVNRTLVEPMNVFRVSVLKGAVQVILVHNHPSGELRESAEDRDITDRLIQVGRILNIKVIDHLIISVKSFVSFADAGIIAKLQKSTKWIPQFELIERIRKEEKRLREQAAKTAEAKGKKEGEKAGIEKGKVLGEKAGLKKGKIEIARTMLKDKEPLEKIVRYTGLTKAEIKRIK